MSQFIIQGQEEALVCERARIVGLCATLTGNVDVAEDLAQEVMLEAWRSMERLRDTEKFSQWLSGIARNVCLRWLRKQGRDDGHLARLSLDEGIALEEQLDDIEVELERKELAELLDRTLAVLPPVTREMLVARYVEESSLTEVAKRFRLETGAVAMRLQRGKLALHRVLSSELAEAWQEYGLRGTGKWEETSVWCPLCGQHRLKGCFRPAEGQLFLTCAACGQYSDTNLAHTSESELFQGMKRVKPALARVRGWIQRYYRGYLDTLMAPCLRCGQMIPMHIISSLEEVDTEHFSEGWQGQRGVYQVCVDCQLHNWTSLNGLVLALPEGQHFLRTHPRIRVLPEQEIEVDGGVAFVTRFESVTDAARFEVVSTGATYRVLAIDGRRL